MNVIPSEAKATIDVRLLPGEDADKFLEAVRSLVNDPSSTSATARGRRVRRPSHRASNTEVFTTIEAAVKRLYNVPTLPMMATGATDMAFLRDKGIQCYGVGPAHRRRGCGRRVLDRTLIRSASWSASCTASCSSTTRSCAISRARIAYRGASPLGLPARSLARRCAGALHFAWLARALARDARSAGF